MITIYWHCLGLTGNDERFVADALNELAQVLRKEPIKLLISIKRLGDKPDIAKQVDAILNRLNDPSYTFSNCAGAIPYSFFKEGIFKEGVPPKLLVYCRPDSYIARAALREKPSAKWGANCGSFSAAYPPKDQLKSKFTIWHETLHLLGLDECYDENTLIRKCKCKTCVMQYEPPLGVDQDWPSPLCDNLCHKNITQLQNLAKNVEEVRRGKKSR